MLRVRFTGVNMSRIQFMRHEHIQGSVTLVELTSGLDFECSDGHIAAFKPGTEVEVFSIDCPTFEAANELLELYAKFRNSDRVMFDVSETLAAIYQEMPV